MSAAMVGLAGVAGLVAGFIFGAVSVAWWLASGNDAPDMEDHVR